MSSARHRRPDPRHDRLGHIVRGLARQRAKRVEAPSRDLAARLDALEADVREVRTRINALFFAVLTAALGELVGRMVL
ncbi:MAG: hypothetical protein M0R75_11900 [Dehalococcoidia bacterium]|nr:hypothetical protein [Dehalococcoidia bacterium]